jgi:hypothetical protein
MGVIPFYIGLIGIVAAAVGLSRAMSRAGFEHNGIAASLLETQEERGKQQDQIIRAIFDPKHLLDRWLIFGGITLCVLAGVSVAVLAYA